MFSKSRSVQVLLTSATKEAGTPDDQWLMASVNKRVVCVCARVHVHVHAVRLTSNPFYPEYCPFIWVEDSRNNDLTHA